MAWLGSWSLEIASRVDRSDTTTIAATAISPLAAPISRVPASELPLRLSRAMLPYCRRFYATTVAVPVFAANFRTQNSQYGGASRACRRSFRRQFSQLRQV